MIDIGDLVTARIHDNITVHGHVRYAGKINGKPGNYIGLELVKEDSHHGKNDGCVFGYVTLSHPHLRQDMLIGLTHASVTRTAGNSTLLASLAPVSSSRVEMHGQLSKMLHALTRGLNPSVQLLPFPRATCQHTLPKTDLAPQRHLPDYEAELP